MATVDEVNQQLVDLAANLTAIRDFGNALDLKVDEIRAFITDLQAGTPVTQTQLDAIFAALDSAKSISSQSRDQAEANLIEVDELDGTVDAPADPE